MPYPAKGLIKEIEQKAWWLWYHLLINIIRFLIVCDDKYYKLARACMYSILKNTKITKITCVIYSDISKIVREPKDSRVNFIIRDVPKGKTDDQLRNFYACVRAYEICKALDKYNNDIVYLDADSLVRNNKTSTLSRETVQILMRKTKFINSKVLLGTIWLPNTKNSKKFAYEWEKLLRRNLYGPWFSDQITFFRTYLQHPSLVSNLDSNFCSTSHLPNETIWHGKGELKFNKNWRHAYTREYFIYSNAMEFIGLVRKITGKTVSIPTSKLIKILILSKIYFSTGRLFKRLIKRFIMGRQT